MTHTLPEWPVGTAVFVRDDDGTLYWSNTRSVPWRLGDGTAVVLLDGIAGGYLLDRVRPVPKDLVVTVSCSARTTRSVEAGVMHFRDRLVWRAFLAARQPTSQDPARPPASPEPAGSVSLTLRQEEPPGRRDAGGPAAPMVPPEGRHRAVVDRVEGDWVVVDVDGWTFDLPTFLLAPVAEGDVVCIWRSP